MRWLRCQALGAVLLLRRGCCWRTNTMQSPPGFGQLTTTSPVLCCVVGARKPEEDGKNPRNLANLDNDDFRGRQSLVF
jgi:hypothetical protein